MPEQAVACLLAAAAGFGAQFAMPVVVPAALFRAQLARDEAGVDLLADDFSDTFSLSRDDPERDGADVATILVGPDAAPQHRNIGFEKACIRADGAGFHAGEEGVGGAIGFFHRHEVHPRMSTQNAVNGFVHVNFFEGFVARFCPSRRRPPIGLLLWGSLGIWSDRRGEISITPARTGTQTAAAPLQDAHLPAAFRTRRRTSASIHPAHSQALTRILVGHFLE